MNKMRQIKVRGLLRVDAVDFGSRQSLSAYVPLLGFK